MKVENPLEIVKSFTPSTRLLCGPGPGNAHPRVHAAMALPQLGHLDPEFLHIVEDLKKLLRYAWQTNEAFTIPVSGTGSAAWEAAVANLTEPGDVHLVCVNGYFGERHCDMASRYGADVRKIVKPFGETFTYEEIRDAIVEHKPALLWVCLAETSTGAFQNIKGIGQLCRENNALFLLDTVTAIGGMKFSLDDELVDASYAGGQKCLSCPPGIAPLMLGPRALAKLEAREKKGEKVKNWYLDMNMIRKYITADGGARVYHHTAPISMIFALREALTLIAEEGLENVQQRHTDVSEFFWGKLEEAGLEMLIKDKEQRLHTLHTIKVPEGYDAGKVITNARVKFNVEIGAGLGSLAGKVFRVGLMGYNARYDVALTVLGVLLDGLQQQGYVVPAKKA